MQVLMLPKRICHDDRNSIEVLDSDECLLYEEDCRSWNLLTA